MFCNKLQTYQKCNIYITSLPQLDFGGFFVSLTEQTRQDTSCDSQTISTDHHVCNFCNTPSDRMTVTIHLWIQGGVRDPLRVRILSFSCSFWQKTQNNRLAHPLWELALPRKISDPSLQLLRQ